MAQDANPTPDQQLRSMLSSAGLSSFEHHKQLGSTNDRALALIRAGTIDTPALILADRQVSGRGQRAKTWSSTNESLTFSWCWRPADSAQSNNTQQPSDAIQRGLIPLAAAVCVVQAITQALPEIASQVSIKWPNDIMIGQCKVAGILVESTGSKDQETFVIGIGINVNQTLETVALLEEQIAQSASGHQLSDFPPTSLRASAPSDSVIDPCVILSTTVERLNTFLVVSRLRASDLLNLAKPKLSFLNQKISLQATNNNVFTGIVVGLAEDGGLMLDVECCASPSNDQLASTQYLASKGESKIKTFHSGSIRLPTSHPPKH